MHSNWGIVTILVAKPIWSLIVSVSTTTYVRIGAHTFAQLQITFGVSELIYMREVFAHALRNS